MRLSILLSLPLTLLACAPGSVKIGDINDLTEETENEENNENNSNSGEDRCCYTIEMFDSHGDGWDQGFIEVLVDQELYAKVNLPSGDGFQEICPAQGAELSMYWHPSQFNDEVAFTIYSPADEVLVQERHPSEGNVLKLDVECSEASSVSPDYQEEGSVGEVFPDDPDDTVDPDDPDDHPNDPVFEGEYWGYFRLTNAQTGYQVCDTEMTVEITSDSEISAAGPCFTPNGHELFVEHQGVLEMEGDWGGSQGGGSDGSSGGSGGMPPEFAYAYAYGDVAMTVPSGDSFSSEFWGECYQEGGYSGVYIGWEMTVQAPNETRYYYGELYTY